MTLVFRLSIVLFFLNASCVLENKTADKKNLLIITRTKGYRHSSIDAGVKLLINLTRKNNIEIEIVSDNASLGGKIRNFDAILLLNTTGNFLDSLEENALMKYVKKGGGIVGIHAAVDAEYKWQWYGKMIGARFKDHPAPQQAALQVNDVEHPATNQLPKIWFHFDEWYNFHFVNDNIQSLIYLDETTYTGGNNGNNHPISWYHFFEGGRVFYTGLGHTEGCYSDSLFINHLWGGIKFAIGN